MELKSKTHEVDASPEALAEFLEEREWGDGLPIVPPTPERVRAMLSRTRGEPDELIGRIPPRWARATLEKLAINAVMAGCAPKHFPVVVAAVEALLDPAYNLYSIQTTTHPVAPLIVVNGPLRQELGLHSGSGAFGPGWRANATIGRAIRLILLNIGGARPGRGDMATQGQPSKYSYCVAENEEENPWESLHVERGFAPTQSTVTVFSGEAPHNVNDHVSTVGENILFTCANMMSNVGSNPLWYMPKSQWFVAFGPEHARTVANDGWSKLDIRRYFFEEARCRLGDLKRGGMYGAHEWPIWVQTKRHDDDWIPVANSPEDFLLMVVGGPGKHSSVIPNSTMGHAVTRPIDRLLPAT